MSYVLSILQVWTPEVFVARMVKTAGLGEVASGEQHECARWLQFAPGPFLSCTSMVPNLAGVVLFIQPALARKLKSASIKPHDNRNIRRLVDERWLETYDETKRVGPAP